MPAVTLGATGFIPPFPVMLEGGVVMFWGSV